MQEKNAREEKGRMKTAVNYSEELKVLYDSGEIGADFFKIPPWIELALKLLDKYPIHVHFDYRAGSGRISEIDFEKTKELFSMCNAQYLSLHLAPMQVDYSGIGIESTDTESRGKVIDQIYRDIDLVAKHFDRKQIVLENVPYFGSHGTFLRLCTLPDLICHVVKESGCGFLFDIAHAKITALNLHEDMHKYIRELPIECTKEMHFHGIQNINGSNQDHLHASERDWALLKWVLDTDIIRDGAQPGLISLEYGGTSGFFKENCRKTELFAQINMLNGILGHDIQSQTIREGIARKDRRMHALAHRTTGQS